MIWILFFFSYLSLQLGHFFIVLDILSIFIYLHVIYIYIHTMHWYISMMLFLRFYHNLVFHCTDAAINGLWEDIFFLILNIYLLSFKKKREKKSCNSRVDWTQPLELFAMRFQFSEEALRLTLEPLSRWLLSLDCAPHGGSLSSMMGPSNPPCPTYRHASHETH